MDIVLFASCLFLLSGSVYLTIRLRFVQVRLLGSIFGLLRDSFSRRSPANSHTIRPHRALFASMSTTLGISTIVSPVIAIHLGGPGALFGFLITSFLGAAATYVEVGLSVQHRKVHADRVDGGPMQYLKVLISPRFAAFYALGCTALMWAWSAAQANQLAAIFQRFHVPTSVSGIVLAVLITVILIGGIRRIGAISARLVPVMFVAYLSACLWVLFANIGNWGAAWSLMISSAFAPTSLASGVAVGGIVSAMRWGTFKGMQSNEAGIGTQTISHSMAAGDPKSQATLAMCSTYMAGLMAFLSGFVALVTNVWQDPNIPVGINMIAAVFQLHFSHIGLVLVAFCTLLFGFGTILGNSYNGSQCFTYLSRNRYLALYLIGTAITIYFGAIAEVTSLWSAIDVVLVCVAIPHMAALMRSVAPARVAHEF